MSYTEEQRARDESLMSPTQLLQREPFLSSVGLERLARMRRDGIIAEAGPIDASENKEDGTPNRKDPLTISPYYLVHKMTALSLPPEPTTYNWANPSAKQPIKAVYDKEGKFLYFDDGYSCMASFKDAATPAQNSDGSYKLSLAPTPDVRKEKGSISFAQTAAMDTAAYYNVVNMPQTMQVDMSALAGAKAGSGSVIGGTSGPSFASTAAPDGSLLSSASPSSAFAPLGGLDAKPITFKQSVPLARNDLVFNSGQEQPRVHKKTTATTTGPQKIELVDQPIPSGDAPLNLGSGETQPLELKNPPAQNLEHFRLGA